MIPPLDGPKLAGHTAFGLRPRGTAAAFQPLPPLLAEQADSRNQAEPCFVAASSP